MRAEESGQLQLYAQAAVLMDADSGRVLYGKNEKEILPMASTTKIMTCIVALEYGNPEEIVEASSYAAGMPKVKLGVTSGETYFMARYPEECQATVEQETGFIEALTGHPQNFMIVAMLSGELVGGCSVMAVSGHIKTRHRGSLGISVEQKAWGGLGTAMIEAALRQAKENGFEQVELGVFEDNPRARHLYEKLGFQEQGRTLRAFRLKDGTYRDEIQMVKFL